ncbi:MAG: hypothetical protein IPQ01_05740 [Zoogloea sp.]|nr:hypothetical protein [Zoogloea sp.]
MPNTTSAATSVPDYLRDTYTWAYLDHRIVPWLDQLVVVSAILWGNAGRLMNAAVREFSAGQRVLQAAAVYGDFSQRLARRLGGEGQLTVLDVASIQIANVQTIFAERQALVRASTAYNHQNWGVGHDDLRDTEGSTGTSGGQVARSSVKCQKRF